MKVKMIDIDEKLSVILRFIRVFISAGVAQAVLVKPDWSSLEETVKLFITAFVAGVISAIFKYLRDRYPKLARLPL